MAVGGSPLLGEAWPGSGPRKPGQPSGADAGCVAGIAASWQGRVGDRTVVELSFRWKKGFGLDPDWQIEDGHVIEVQGRPTVMDLVPADLRRRLYPVGRLDF